MNIPKSVTIVDRQKKSLVRTRPLSNVVSNYAMALDEANHCLIKSTSAMLREMSMEYATMSRESGSMPAPAMARWT